MQADRPNTRSDKPGWKRRWIEWRNGVIGSQRFQRWAARNPLTRRVARKRSAALFDLVAGFTYTQILLALVDSGLLDRIGEKGAALDQLVAAASMSDAATLRLLRAAAALDLTEEAEPGFWMLGEQGAALLANHGARAMIQHHSILYRDLGDPVALLRDDREQPTALSKFWRYVGSQRGDAENSEDSGSYSHLMASSQAMVAEQVLATGAIDPQRSLLDVGGGYGAFARAIAAAHPGKPIGIFDLPDVITAITDTPGVTPFALHQGDFFADPIPTGYDSMSLVRILHDHDDEPAQQLLENIRRSLEPGQQLILAEPMANEPGARRMGDAYFGLYLWAMRSGRPRTVGEIGAMLEQAGFARWRKVATDLPVITSIVVATA